MLVISLRSFGMSAVLAGLLALFGAGVAVARPAPALANLAVVKPVMDCAALASADVSDAVGAKTTISSAKLSGSGDQAFCAVQGVIAPKIRFELRLPTAGWTQRYLQVGCGGLCGVLSIRTEHADGCTPVKDGAIALASTDMGHEGKGGMAAMGDGAFGADPQARIDFAYRGVHLTSVASKALIARFYGQAPRYSYFSGCSDGGREALMEAQRFPGDFDGIAAGAPAMVFTVQNSFYHAWQARSNMDAAGKAILVASRLPILHAAALASCDAVDGLEDGQIDDPRACRFDPVVAQCKPGQASDACLTPAEVETARKLYDGPRDAAGKAFTLGQPQVGSELSWAGVFVPRSADQVPGSWGMAEQPVKYVLSQTNPPADYSLADFKFTPEQFAGLSWAHGLYDATDTDLSAFAAKGGKLILWHGWSDPHISPLNTIAYRNGVVAELGQAKADAMMRLFLFPGLYHCFGGDGLSQFDIVSPLMAWVEAGAAPNAVVAAKVDMPAMTGPPPAGADVRQAPMPDASALKPERVRPVYAYPQVAAYTGSGSIDAPENFAPKTPASEPAVRDAYAAQFIAPRFHQDCRVEAGALACAPSKP
ncbi:tannase/feruloyl esterase family alpha/beta hydrolase [Caulobacter sp. D4A]|uniref:tannase/feruloyl esterase family alpha/beta hydrolase n=1 Tax=unclassified Caulobacter TaxID=2648921 RepID=UPI000D72E78A|nr:MULTISPECIES: tannase/feruloyl esterase family alpha/beta hydrolase [unclassified Caulobacter]PXA78594.1 tannase/feruloyl esterase family alpha/beta hydrolase [Caulobacter sp. D4A]PXA96748.1 tannase/feruloyl esterase family alpha/beta hydrolase [Caulobacter sp. D5]